MQIERPKGRGRGRDALLSFSRHKLVKGPLAATRGGDINCLPGDMTLDRLFRAGLTLVLEGDPRRAGFRLLSPGYRLVLSSRSCIDKLARL